MEPAKGNSCMNPWLVQNLPYTKSSSTDGIFNDSVNTGGGCDSVFGVGEGVTDVVYEFKPTVTGDYLVELEGLETGASPSVLYAVNDCEEPESACVGYTDTIESGSAALQVTLESDKVVYIVVDGVVASDIGAFTFSMTGPL